MYMQFERRQHTAVTAATYGQRESGLSHFDLLHPQHVALLSGQRADEAGGQPEGQAAPGAREDQVPVR